MTRVLFVRHGETTWNREGRVQGWASTPLTGRGRDQARETGVYLREVGVDRVLSSDLRRARATARLVREGARSADCPEERPGVDASLSFEQAWRERDFGEFQGLTRAAIADRHEGFDPEGSLVAVESIPDGESLADFCRRVAAGWESLSAGVDDETVAVVTHGGPLRAVVADITGDDVPGVAREWSPDNCGVTEVDVSGTPEIVRRDDTTHLE
ncbi:MAG: histidine phosphatase family protein [Haloarculaceae archaeon]